MDARHHLAIDLGAESGRAIVGSITGEALSLQEVHRFANTPLHLSTGLHWDSTSLWRQIKTGISTAARAYPLASLGLDSWGVDFALLGKDGSLLGQPQHYRDARTDGMLEEAFRRVPRAEIFAQTGIQFMQINALYQLLAMLTAGDARLEQARTFLTISDLFNYWLTGKIACEFTIATTTQCFDPLKRVWAVPLLRALGIPVRIFPPICDPGTPLGALLPAVAPETGAPPIPVIAPACHDTASAVAAVPAEGGSFAWLSSGTWSILGAEVAQPNLSEKALACNFTNEGGVFGTWRLCRNTTGLWLVQECKRAWELSYDEITRLAGEAQPFLAVIDVDDPAFLHPAHMPQAIQRACAQSGQGVPQTPGQIARVALESLALKYRLLLEQLEDLTGTPLEPLHIIGGGTKNTLLNQLSADATGRRVVAGPVEATAAGNILMQALALGELTSLKQARAVVRHSFALSEYTPRLHPGWEQALARLRTLTGAC